MSTLEVPVQYNVNPRNDGWYQRHSLQWRHNEHDGISNHRGLDCLLNHLFRCRSKKTSKLCITGLCEGNSPVTGQFPAQRASNMENVSIWWYHHVRLMSITHQYKSSMSKWHWSECFCTLQWRHNGRDGVSNHQPCDFLLNRLIRWRSKKTSKLRVPGLCVGNSPLTGQFPAQRASNMEKVSIWWHHHIRLMSITHWSKSSMSKWHWSECFCNLGGWTQCGPHPFRLWLIVWSEPSKTIQCTLAIYITVIFFWRFHERHGVSFLSANSILGCNIIIIVLCVLSSYRSPLYIESLYYTAPSY